MQLSPKGASQRLLPRLLADAREANGSEISCDGSVASSVRGFSTTAYTTAEDRRLQSYNWLHFNFTLNCAILMDTPTFWGKKTLKYH